MGDDEDQRNNAKKKDVVEEQDYFFDDLIIEEILLRLPVKSVLRFKSVSKQWYSTLSSSKFANAHFIKSPLSHPSAPVNTLFIESCNNYYLFSYDNDKFEDSLVILDAKFCVKEDNRRTLLTGCCNGLICLTPEHANYFIMWNPATRKRRKYELAENIPSHNVSGFGYASSIDDYKYVRISTLLCIGQGINTIVHIFSFRKNKWKEINFDHEHECSLFFYGQAVLINEKLYWAACDSTDSDSYIVSFDLEIERFDVIKSKSRLVFLGNMGGCLSKCYKRTFKNKLSCIVELLAVGKSIDVPITLGLDPLSQMIGFTRTGKFFITCPPDEDEERQYPLVLEIVDPGINPIRYTRLLRFHGHAYIARYVPSLVSPFLIEERSET